MARYIELDALVAKIENLMNRYDSEYDEDSTEVNAAKGNVCHEILCTIGNLGVKEVDLEKEIYNAEKRFGDIDEMGGYQILIFDDEFRDILRHFFELGLKAHKGK